MCGSGDDVHTWGIWMAAKGVVDSFAESTKGHQAYMLDIKDCNTWQIIVCAREKRTTGSRRIILWRNWNPSQLVPRIPG